MAVYILAATLLVAIPFLLYCLWNFSRQIKPRKAPVFYSAVSTLGSVQATPLSPHARQNAPSDSGRKVVRRPERDYASPAQAS
jgi:hypothetical protein